MEKKCSSRLEAQKEEEKKREKNKITMTTNFNGNNGGNYIIAHMIKLQTLKALNSDNFQFHDI